MICALFYLDFVRVMIDITFIIYLITVRIKEKHLFYILHFLYRIYLYKVKKLVIYFLILKSIKFFT